MTDRQAALLAAATIVAANPNVGATGDKIIAQTTGALAEHFFGTLERHRRESSPGAAVRDYEMDPRD